MANKPIIYSCSGCSNVAQLTNDVALHLDKQGIAEMSCIAGVGGGVPALVKKAKSGRKIIALDGCPLHCVKYCLDSQDIKDYDHLTLTDHDFKKRFKEKFDEKEIDEVCKIVVKKMI